MARQKRKPQEEVESLPEEGNPVESQTINEQPLQLAGGSPDPVTNHAEQIKTEGRQVIPDPFCVMSISLGADNTSPQIRMYRSNKFRQMAIQFHVKPEEKYLNKLRENGFRWRNQDQVWTKQLDKDTPWLAHIEAERLCTEIGNGIRADLGLEPCHSLGS